MHKAVLKDSSTSFGVYGFDDITEQPLQLYIHLQLSYELFRVHSEEEILCQSRSKFVQFAENSSLLRLLRQLLTQLNYIAPFHNKFCEPHWLQFHSGWPEIQVCYCGLATKRAIQSLPLLHKLGSPHSSSQLLGIRGSTSLEQEVWRLFQR